MEKCKRPVKKVENERDAPTGTDPGNGASGGERGRESGKCGRCRVFAAAPPRRRFAHLGRKLNPSSARVALPKSLDASSNGKWWWRTTCAPAIGLVSDIVAFVRRSLPKESGHRLLAEFPIWNILPAEY